MKRFSGTEKITDEQGNSVSTVQDFWAWAYSNLTSNTQRGIFAEYLVSVALNSVDTTSQDKIRTDWADWGPYDVKTPEEIKVEVKSSGYIQAWKQSGFSKIMFGIAQTHEFDFETDAYKYASDFIRHADVYVFCVETCKNRDELNERDLSQWDFYVVPTTIINNTLGSQKTVSLSKLIKIGARKTQFSDLRQAVISAANHSEPC